MDGYLIEQGTKAHDWVGGSDRANDSELAVFFEHLDRGYDRTRRATGFELQLAAAKLLPGLEEAGILPVPENPNPYDPELEEELNNQWSDAHPDEMSEFFQTIEKRDEVLEHLHAGALLGHLLGQRIFPQIKPR